MLCQFCGNEIPPSLIDGHIQRDCKKRPSDHIEDLPSFNTPTSSTPKPSIWPSLGALGQPTPAVVKSNPSHEDLLKTRLNLVMNVPEEDELTNARQRTSAPGSPPCLPNSPKDMCKKIFESYFEFQRDGHSPFTPPVAETPEHSGDRIYSVVPPCKYCRLPFAAHEHAQRIMHQRLCPHNPTFKQACCYCSLEFTSTFEKLATELVADHEDMCMANPTNICPYCLQGFGGAPGISHVEEIRYKLEVHKNVCPQRRDNYSSVSEG